MKVDVIVLIVVRVLLLLRQLVTTSVSAAEVAGAPCAALRVAEALFPLPLTVKMDFVRCDFVTLCLCLCLPLTVKMDFVSFENKGGRETTVKKLIGGEVRARRNVKISEGEDKRTNGVTSKELGIPPTFPERLKEAAKKYTTERSKA